MYNRYPNKHECGLRLDNEDNPQVGCALDTGVVGPPSAPYGITLWIRDEVGQHVNIELDLDDVQALRDFCTYVLVRVKREKYEQVTVPV